MPRSLQGLHAGGAALIACCCSTHTSALPPPPRSEKIRRIGFIKGRRVVVRGGEVAVMCCNFLVLEQL